MVGADICGFLGDTTEELCARWIEVGAFYPFARNHNALGQKSQELYLWPSVTEASQKALGMRYQLLPYLYSAFYRAHSYGGVVAASLWFNFPADEATVDLDEQFMLGKSVLVSPVLHQGQSFVDAYFPQQLWYDFHDYTLAVDATGGGGNRGGKYVTLATGLTDVNVHVKGGSILPLQQVSKHRYTRTRTCVSV